MIQLVAMRLEKFLSQLVKPTLAQKAVNVKHYGSQMMSADRVEAFRNFGCMGCGSSQHLVYLADHDHRSLTWSRCSHSRHSAHYHTCTPLWPPYAH
eukprot:COSAG06_NODE_2603_length_6593_cov_14.090699_3_plen_96_part_00